MGVSRARQCRPCAAASCCRRGASSGRGGPTMDGSGATIGTTRRCRARRCPRAACASGSSACRPASLSARSSSVNSPAAPLRPRNAPPSRLFVSIPSGGQMRVLLVDLPARDGVVSKDTVVGGYGSRLLPFTRVTHFIGALKRRMHDVQSVQLAYLAGVLSQYGHDVIWSRGEMPEADVAIVLSSLVDYRHETAWADQARARGIHTGFVGLTASKLPELFRDHADFLVFGEPESAVQRLARG